MAGGQVVAGSWVSPVTPTAAQPLQQVNSITGLDAVTGRQLWSASGDTGDPMSLSAASGGGAVARAVTSDEDVETYGADGSSSASTAGGTGDYLSATTASVASAGTTDLVAGNADGDVSALDGKDLASGVNHVLWSTHLAGPVNDIVRAELNGQPVLVAAATSEVAVLAARTGTVLTLIKTPGTYAYTVTVISAAGTPAVVVPGSALTGYALATGQRLWQYAAQAGASFSDAAYADGTVAAEYANSSGHGRFERDGGGRNQRRDRPARLVAGRRHRHDPARQPVGRRLRRPRYLPARAATGWPSPGPRPMATARSTCATSPPAPSTTPTSRRTSARSPSTPTGRARAWSRCRSSVRR